MSNDPEMDAALTRYAAELNAVVGALRDVFKSFDSQQLITVATHILAALPPRCDFGCDVCQLPPE